MTVEKHLYLSTILLLINKLVNLSFLLANLKYIYLCIGYKFPCCYGIASGHPPDIRSRCYDRIAYIDNLNQCYVAHTPVICTPFTSPIKLFLDGHKYF